MGQYCFARWRLSASVVYSLSSIVVCNAAGGRAGKPPGAWAVGRPTLHGGPLLLCPVRATPCLILRRFSDRSLGHWVKIGSIHGSKMDLVPLYNIFSYPASEQTSGGEI